MFRRFFGLAFLALISQTALLFGQTPPTTVPSEWLQGSRLKLEQFNCSIDAPAPEWRWSYKKLSDIQNASASTFTATGPSDEEYSLIVWHKASSGFKQEDASQFVRGMQESLPRGWTPGEVKVVQSQLPVTGSANFHSQITMPDGRALYQHGYLVPGRSTYLFITYAGSPDEPPLFTSFVKSFRIIDVAENEYHPPNPVIAKNIWNIITPYLLIILITMIVDLAKLIAARSGRAAAPALDGQTPLPHTTAWSKYLIVVSVFANLVNGYLMNFDRDIPYMLGGTVALFFWSFGIAYIAYGRKKRWNSFARLFFWLTIFNPALMARSGARRAA